MQRTATGITADRINRLNPLKLQFREDYHEEEQEEKSTKSLANRLHEAAAESPQFPHIRIQ